MKALILSGGTGTRLRPLTYSSAKQLLPVANKPILFYIIDKIADTGINDIGIIVGDTRAEIEAAVGNGSIWGVNITYIYQSQPHGLAHAVKTAAGFLKDEHFMMILGDNLFQMDLKAIIKEFSDKPANALLLLHESDNPSKYGVAVVNGERIIRLVEKPKNPPSNLIITGIYIFDHSIFAAIDKTVASARNELEITDAIQKLLDTGGTVGYILTEGWWKDTGSFEDILKANRLVLDEMEPDFNDIPNCGSILEGSLRAGENVVITDSILYGPVVLGSNISINRCRIGPFVAIGDNASLSECKIEDSIILEGSVIKNINKIITSSLIGKNSRIEACGDEQQTMCFFIGNDSKIIL